MGKSFFVLLVNLLLFSPFERGTNPLKLFFFFSDTLSLPPPLLSPSQKSRRDVGNFDKEFTKMAVELTPTDKLFIMNLDQNEFQGFSYTNPEFIIQV